MAILKASMHKSGNLWLSKILRSITRHAGWEYTTWVQRKPIHATALTWQLSYSGQADMDFLSILPDGCYWRISDLAPTLLALLGISAPPDMPGRPHASLLASAERNPV